MPFFLNFLFIRTHPHPPIHLQTLNKLCVLPSGIDQLPAAVAAAVTNAAADTDYYYEPALLSTAQFFAIIKQVCNQDLDSFRSNWM